MINLLKETLDVMTKNGKSAADVQWVGDKTGAHTWQEFEREANIDYDNGYGSQAIDRTLVIVGRDWWLERHEYDGAEWWEYKTLPTRPDNSPEALRVCEP